MPKDKTGPKSRHEGMFKPGESGNSKGRPPGAKNKNKLPRPERMLLNAEDGAIQNLIALAKNDIAKLGRKQDTPANVQYQAINRVLELVKEVKAKMESLDENEDVDDNVTSLFSTKAK